ncbi:hypothetical protein OG259_26610 [Streptomyces sp. NBC_00250]|uniref:hypothetical protein n=1 Tax=Streptomyces sp. NBC_00250 TaxID=2903641 RepID=UPI002E296333|nr:hypothetical protein [Streptomyces sp. NBC_00250]
MTEPRFDDVYHAPLEKLKSAADAWSEMTGKLDKLAEDASTGMRTKAHKADWRGVNAEVTKPFVDKTAKEFADAAAAAKGMHQILADGHTTIKAVRDALRRIVEEEAPAAGLRVDSEGKVSAADPLANHYREWHNDPDYEGAVQREKAKIVAMQQRVDRLVEDAADADDSLARALRANSPDEHDFRAPKYRTLDQEQADRAATLMKQVTGDGGTARNVEALRELEEVLDDNRNDPEFAVSFYRGIGPEGTLQSYARLSLDSTGLGPAGQDRAALVAGIQGDMGNILGLATQKSTPGHLDAAWTADLMRAGRKEMDITGISGVNSRVYGYQALGALLREGTYDTEFLTGVGRDMVAMDRKDPKAWEWGLPHNMEQRLNLGEEGGKGFYPLTGLMEALSNNPEAATAFFNEPVRQDSNGDGIVTKADNAVDGVHGKPRGMVDYMLDQRPAVDWYDAQSLGGGDGAQAAVGDALETAVTHRPPGDLDETPVKHTQAMADVLERVVAKIGENPELVVEKPGDDPAPLRELSGHFGRMAAEYMPDFQASAENGADMIKPFGAAAELDKSQMARFLGAVGQDPSAYGAITSAQQAYTTALVHDVLTHRAEHSELDAAIGNAVHPGGEIAGIMSEARAQAVHENQLHEDEEFNKAAAEEAKWVNRVISAAGAKYLEMLPLAGDVVGWIQEDVTESVLETGKQDKADESRRESSDGYADAEKAAKASASAAVAAAARDTDLTATDIKDLQGVASTKTAAAHSIGRDLVATERGH